MSRRFHLGILEKIKHEEIKSLSFKELKVLFGDQESISISQLSKEMFTIGKSFDDSFLKEFSSPAFTSAEVHALINEEDAFYLINKKGFEALIENFRIKISAHFKELLGTADQLTDQSLSDERFSYIYFRLQEWGNDLNIKPYSLEGDAITNSSNLEYSIFELIRIYKNINWETQLISISAW